MVQGAASNPAFCLSRKFKVNQATVIRADFKTRKKILKQVRKETEGQSQKKSFLGESHYKLKAGVAALRGGREGPDSCCGCLKESVITPEGREPEVKQPDGLHPSIDFILSLCPFCSKTLHGPTAFTIISQHTVL